MIRSSSIAAFHASKPKRVPQYEQVLAALVSNGGPMTRRQLSIATGVEFCSIPDRVNTLINRGDVSELPDKAKCPVTGQSVYWVQAKPRQHSLGRAA